MKEKTKLFELATLYHSNKASHFYIGLSHYNDQIFVYGLKNKEIFQHVFPIADFASIEQKVCSAMAIKPKQIHWVMSLAPHLLWQKEILLEHPISVQEAHEQCLFLLEQALPVPLEQLWFDYRLQPIRNSNTLTKLQIVAVQQQLALNFIDTLFPLSIQIIDTQTEAILRAIQFLFPTQIAHIENCIVIHHHQLFLYHWKHMLFLQHINLEQLSFIQLNKMIVHVFKQFSLNPSDHLALIYHEDSETSLISQLSTLKGFSQPHFFPFTQELIALGNSLWDEDSISNLVEAI